MSDNVVNFDENQNQRIRVITGKAFDLVRDFCLENKLPLATALGVLEMVKLAILQEEWEG